MSDTESQLAKNNLLSQAAGSNRINRRASIMSNSDGATVNRSTLPRLNGRRQPSPRLVIPLSINGAPPINLSSSTNPDIAVLEEKAKADDGLVILPKQTDTPGEELESEQFTELLSSTSGGTGIADAPKENFVVINKTDSMTQSTENGLGPPIISPSDRSNPISSSVPQHTDIPITTDRVPISNVTTSAPVQSIPPTIPVTPSSNPPQKQQIPESIPTPQQAAQNASPQKPPPQPHNFTPVSIQNMLKYPGQYSHIPDYDAMPTEEQYRFRTQFQTEFGRLRKAWPTYEIPLIGDMPLRMVHVTYEVFCRSIAVYNKVDEYKFYIAVILLTVEVCLVKFMQWPVKDLTQLLWKAMPFLEKYLFEMAENYYTGGGGSWSPEANLIYYGCIFAVFIIGFKVICSSILSQSTMEWIVNIVTQFIGGLSSVPQTTTTGNNVASLPTIGHSLGGFGVDSFANTAPGLLNSFIPTVGATNNNNNSTVPQPQAPNPRPQRDFYDE